MRKRRKEKEGGVKKVLLQPFHCCVFTVVFVLKGKFFTLPIETLTAFVRTHLLLTMCHDAIKQQVADSQV